jgi:hypothetical protein
LLRWHGKASQNEPGNASHKHGTRDVGAAFADALLQSIFRRVFLAGSPPRNPSIEHAD